MQESRTQAARVGVTLRATPVTRFARGAAGCHAHDSGVVEDYNGAAQRRRSGVRYGSRASAGRLEARTRAAHLVVCVITVGWRHGARPVRDNDRFEALPPR